jgi:hypothetical protein
LPVRWCNEENSAASSGTLATHDALFIGLLIGTVLLVGALTFIPALALGPLAEHFPYFKRCGATCYESQTLALLADAGAPGAAGCREKLSPRVQWRNPVMFIVWVGSC